MARMAATASAEFTFSGWNTGIPRAIDSRTEEDIHTTLRRLMRGRTTLLVAHRRSTLELADRIVVVDRGRVQAEGTHEELSAATSGGGNA